MSRKGKPALPAPADAYIRNPEGLGGFQKGFSGNPTGKQVGALKKRLRDTAGEHLDEMIQILLEHCRNPHPGVSMAALKEYFDRVLGRAAPGKAEEDDKTLDLSNMTMADFNKVIRAALVIQNGKVVEPRAKVMIEGKVE